jgi:hypothetical protein
MSILVPLLCLVGASAAVSFLLAACIRSRFLVVAASLVITELVCLLLLYRGIAASPDAPEVIHVPGLLAVAISPIILLTSVACVAMMTRLRQGKRPV